jgi:hypothetical protein
VERTVLVGVNDVRSEAVSGPGYRPDVRPLVALGHLVEDRRERIDGTPALRLPVKVVGHTDDRGGVEPPAQQSRRSVNVRQAAAHGLAEEGPEPSHAFPVRLLGRRRGRPRSPVLTPIRLPGPDLQHRARRQAPDRLKEGALPVFAVARQVLRNPDWTQGKTVDGVKGPNCLNFRREGEKRVIQHVVKRSDADVIAGAREAPGVLIPERDGESSANPLYPGRIPLLIRQSNVFAIGPVLKPLPTAQLLL